MVQRTLSLFSRHRIRLAGQPPLDDAFQRVRSLRMFAQISQYVLAYSGDVLLRLRVHIDILTNTVVPSVQQNGRQVTYAMQGIEYKDPACSTRGRGWVK